MWGRGFPLCALNGDVKAKLGLLVVLNKLSTLPDGGDAPLPLSEFRWRTLEGIIDFSIETPGTTKAGVAQTAECCQVALEVFSVTGCRNQQPATLLQKPENLLLLSITMRDSVLHSSHC